MNEYVGNYRFHCSICGKFVGKDGIIMFIDKNGIEQYPTKEVNTAWYYIQDIHRSQYTPWWSVLRMQNGGKI